MQSRALMMLFLSLVAGIAAVVFAARWLNDQAAVTQQVVVAAREASLGQPLTATMLQTMPWPASAIPKGAFTNFQGLEGRVLVANVQQGEVIVESRLAPVGTRGGLSAVISGGKRAITVKVNEVVGVAGFALPGNFVDVMVNTEDEVTRQQISKIVLERILVLAVAQEASRDELRPKVVNAVTLEVTPSEAEKVDLARSVGNLSLVLRNQIDSDATQTVGIRKSDLLGTAPSPQPAAPAPQAAAQPARVPAKAAPKAPPPVAKPEPVVIDLQQDRPMVEVIRGLHRANTEL
jgi:pilus assembly protein CpaB